MIKFAFLAIAACAICYAIIHSTARDLEAFDEHMRIQDSLDIVNKASRDSLNHWLEMHK